LGLLKGSRTMKTLVLASAVLNGTATSVSAGIGLSPVSAHPDGGGSSGEMPVPGLCPAPVADLPRLLAGVRATAVSRQAGAHGRQIYREPVTENGRLETGSAGHGRTFLYRKIRIGIFYRSMLRGSGSEFKLLKSNGRPSICTQQLKP